MVAPVMTCSWSPRRVQITRAGQSRFVPPARHSQEAHQIFFLTPYQIFDKEGSKALRDFSAPPQFTDWQILCSHIEYSFSRPRVAFLASFAAWRRVRVCSLRTHYIKLTPRGQESRSL